MKRNLILSIAVAIIMMATTVAQAADVSFSGEFRPRYNVDNDSSDSTSPNHFFDTRARLNAKANVNANTQLFLQFQSVGVWGGGAANSGTRESTGGATGAGDAAEASDLLNDVGFHQAHLTLKNVAGKSVDAKIGRQEVVIDGHRLFGHTGWTQGAETKDAIRLNHAAGNHTLNYTYIMGDENDGNANNTDQDYSVHVLHAQTQGIMGGALSGIFTLTNNDNTTAESGDNSQWYTVGARQKGKMGGLDYRVEFYHQFGDAGNIANTCACAITGAAANSADAVDRDAQMFGLRVGKTFKNAQWSPTFTLWYDLMTGVDDESAAAGDWGQFDTMYDTGHKFYGFQDFYLNRTGANTGYYGIQDIALKTKMSPAAGWTIKMDWHHFRTHTDISGVDADTVIATDATLGGAMDNDLGTEVDLTLVHKYDSNTKIVAGFSQYWTTSTFATVNGAGGTAGSNSNDDSEWAYLQVHTKF
jgi:hypothetical protein